MLERVLQDLGPLLVAKAPSAVREQAVSLLARALDNARPLIGALRERNIGDTLRLQSAVATDLAQLQLALLPAQALPYEVPAVWAGLPQLRGRAEYTSADATIHLTLDGFHAPVTAGNFASLVNEGYFDRMPIQQLTAISIQTGNAKQAGRPVNKRTIPLEIFYKRDAAPTYSYTSDEDKRGAETLALPFQSYGALGMARQSADLGGEIDNDSATSEFFFVKYDQALIPPGRNTLDGAYSCFGYTSEGATYLRQLELGDTIVSAKLISGLENLISGK
ncbi:cyclophilin type peptidyl-prolyl cis-trans isomerase/CLD-domain-containing protein [Pavlovales sp. CCMP2436]|nr:cyclophilin type peptidyl-prolyl cis-trans isomerase/CLD-domain-containing protein [Pavlovales sp. CCMP2436]